MCGSGGGGRRRDRPGSRLGGVAVGSVAVVGTAVTGVHILGANALPFMLCLLWMLAVSVRLGIRRTGPAVEATPDVEPVGV